MLDTLQVFEELKEALQPDAAKKIAFFMGKMYRELSNVVTKEEFNELKNSINNLAEKVQDLTEAQINTEKSLNKLFELHEKSEERLANIEKWQELTEQRLANIAKWQEKTEERLANIEKWQEKTEKRLNELTIAVEKLTISLDKTQKELKETKQLVGNISDRVGYLLEDRAIKNLPPILKNRYGIKIKERLVRKFVSYNGKTDELNIFGIGEKQNKEIYILGESKSRLSKRHIDNFLKMVKRLEKNKIIGKEKFLFMITYTVHLEIEEYAKEKGIEVIWSYEV